MSNRTTQAAGVLVGLFAFVHAVTQRADAFTAADRLSKPAWMAITGGATVAMLLFQFYGAGMIFWLAALVADGTGARLWVPAARSRASAFAPDADLRGPRDLPVLIVAPAEAADLGKALGELAGALAGRELRAARSEAEEIRAGARREAAKLREEGEADAVRVRDGAGARHGHRADPRRAEAVGGGVEELGARERVAAGVVASCHQDRPVGERRRGGEQAGRSHRADPR